MPRRGENIFKRKDGRWEARYVKEIMLDGTKKYGSVYAKTYTEVKQKQNLCVSKVITKNISAPILISQLMQQWLFTIKNQVKITTYQKYESIVNNHINPNIGNMRIDCFTTIIASEFSNLLLKTLSYRSVNCTLIVLGMALKYANENYNINIAQISFVKEPRKEMRVLSKKEQNILIAYLINDIDIYKLGVLIALSTGIRIGELCALQWTDIQNETIKINKTMQRIKDDKGGTKIIIMPPKSESSIRNIPLPDFLIPFLEQYKKSEGYLLSQPNGKYVEPRLLQLQFEKYIKACNLNHANFHSLRHTFATRCVESGWDIKSLSEVLGHSDVKTTLNRYVHSSFEQKKLNMNKLNFGITI